MRGFGRPVRLCAGSGGQGDLLSELQYGAGSDIGDCVQGERAEDKDKGSVWVFASASI